MLKPAIELLAGIPSVVYGFFGLIVLTDFIRVTFDIPTGETWLAASILLGIMALPTIISVSEDAISAVPREFREGSLAVGATRWQTISKVIVPAALPGIAAAIILGIGRAIGETMAVMMVAGNAAVIPDLRGGWDHSLSFRGYLGSNRSRTPVWYLTTHRRDSPRHDRGDSICRPAFDRLCYLRIRTRIPAGKVRAQTCHRTPCRYPFRGLRVLWPDCAD